ncbi:hypothetical protein AB1Y20_012570 [Prymnesium parvum]|uniref:Major facilitator superfamily (MFS) profile domain-containing protein n=1 Tax=Prymnesium parvum TaxID=97485 RepID=A0AB34IKX3_PRYPA
MLVRLALLGSSVGFLYGYDLGVVAATLPLLAAQAGLTASQLEAVAAHTRLGAAIGACLGARLVRRGPRAAAALCALAFGAGALLAASADHPSWWPLAAGRLLSGGAIGLSAVTAPLYLSDIAPPSLRGAVVALFELQLTVGVLAASLVCNVAQLPASAAWLAQRLPALALWRLLVLLPVVPSLLLLCAALCLPDPPSRLVARGQVDRAFSLLLRLHSFRRARAFGAPRGSTSEWAWGGTPTGRSRVSCAADESFSGYGAERLLRFTSGSTSLGSFTALPLSTSHQNLRTQEAIAFSAQRHLDAIVAAHTISSARTRRPSLSQLLFGRERRAARLALALAVCNHANGVATVSLYLGTILTRRFGMGGSAAGALSCAVLFVKVLAVVAATLVVDRVGRRRLLLLGSLTTAAGLALVAVAISISSPWLTILFVGLTTTCYAGSMAPVFYILLAELFSDDVRILATVAATSVTFATGAVADSVFLSLCAVVGYEGTLASFAAVSILGGGIVLRFLPETKGLSRLAILRVMASDQVVPTSEHAAPDGRATLQTELSAEEVVGSQLAEQDPDETALLGMRTSSALALAA